MQRTRKGSIFILLAPGFEEYDVVVVARTLRGRGLPVAMVGLTAGPIRGRYGMAMATDKTLSETEAEQPLAVILPGGIEGTRQLNGDPRVHYLLRRATEQRAYVVALEPGETVLRTAGIVNDVESRAKEDVSDSSGGRPDERALVDGPLIWGRGAGAAEESALVLASLLESRAGAR